jgi:hypothetical protein
MYGIAHCLVDRDGRVIGCNLPIANGPLLEQAREWLDSWGFVGRRVAGIIASERRQSGTGA